MTQAWTRLIMDLWGQTVTLRTAEGEKEGKAFLQPKAGAGERVPTGMTVQDGVLVTSDGAWNAVGFFEDGTAIRRCAVENGVTIFTSLDTVRVTLDVLEEMTMAVSTIDAK